MRKSRGTKRGVYLCICVLTAVYTALCAAVRADRILPRTRINGVALGGMTEEEAVLALETEARSRREKTLLTVSFEGREYRIDVGAALEYDSRAAAKEALRPGREPFLARGIFWLKKQILGRDCIFPPVTDTEILRKTVASSGLLEADTSVRTSYEEKDDRLIITLGRDGRKVAEEELLEEIPNAVLSGNGEKRIECPTVVSAAEPVDPEKLCEEVYRDAADARLDPENGYEIIPSVTGADLDREQLQGLLASAKQGDTIEVSFTYTDPEVSTEDLEEHIFENVLAECSTSVGGSENRRSNIRVAVDRCNGTILNAGDEFSFNNTVGEQTAETGFKKANAILDGKIIQAYGGGICQVSTTIFEAALYAGLEIPERWCHTYISSYADAGMDAAVAWDALDLRIANNQKYPVKLEVTYENGRLTAVLWGTRAEELPVEIETEILDDSGDFLKVMTYRKIFSADRSHFSIEKIAYSEYLNSGKRVD